MTGERLCNLLFDKYGDEDTKLKKKGGNTNGAVVSPSKVSVEKQKTDLFDELKEEGEESDEEEDLSSPDDPVLLAACIAKFSQTLS